MKTSGALLAVFIVFAIAGIVVGVSTQRDSRVSEALDDQAVRHVVVEAEYVDSTGQIADREMVELWIDSAENRSRAEVRSSDGQLRLIEVRDRELFERLKFDSGVVVYSSSSVLPSSPRASVGYAERLTIVGTEVERGTLEPDRVEFRGGKPVSVVRGSTEGEDGRTYVVEEFVDEASGITTLREVRASDGQLLESARYMVVDDSDALGEAELFRIDVPVDALVYIDAEMDSSAVANFNDFKLFALPEQTDYELYGVTATESRGPVALPRHLVHFLYRSPSGGWVTITNQPAAGLIGVPRCEVPRPVAPGSGMDVIHEGNAACDFGEEVVVNGKGAVARSDSPTVEVVLGGTAVFVHAGNPMEAIELAEILEQLN